MRRKVLMGQPIGSPNNLDWIYTNKIYTLRNDSNLLLFSIYTCSSSFAAISESCLQIVPPALAALLSKKARPCWSAECQAIGCFGPNFSMIQSCKSSTPIRRYDVDEPLLRLPDWQSRVKILPMLKKRLWQIKQHSKPSAKLFYSEKPAQLGIPANEDCNSSVHLNLSTYPIA